MDFEPIDPKAQSQYRSLLKQSFNFPDDYIEPWFEWLNTTQMRGVYRDHQLVGGLSWIKIGQWYGGRVVPASGISAVAVTPEGRGEGVATVLLRECITELYEEGFPLAILYPTTVPLYRKAGFELAGMRLQYHLSLFELQLLQSSEMEVVKVPIGYDEKIDVFYRAQARSHGGLLDRTKQMWEKLYLLPENDLHLYRIENNGNTEGYVCLMQTPGNESIMIRDWFASSPAATARILQLIKGHAPMFTELTWRGGPQDSFLSSLSDPAGAKISSYQEWMARIVDVEKAFSMRGFPHGRATTLHFEIKDPWVEANCGRFILTVSNEGDVSVERGGEGTLRIDIKGVASLYTSHRTAHQLQREGLLHTEDEDSLSEVTMLFAGPNPWMTDIF
ncbi:enhanced intracellular survival protein Eis [Mechercharimyces sp. CAU 1602]|uniref:GNAT family N-acetyltransferase n=1 Tax=Mechercharimyces sp. CAU 1602 TaxID=2973933 RepID=UPI0021627DBB|nr:GNAT family N-acetyltransferase [Mechercharimyces sp. CAU 1602]MCS1350727.1 GNAT family N-acetyltransferase [Mechercharimyces sp. CAU 1602]